MTYSVKGEAHGSTFDEPGFTSREAAEAYASQAIDGDTESTVEVIQEDGRDAELARLFRNFHDQVAAMNQAAEAYAEPETRCPECGGPAQVWADNSGGVTINFACDNAACASGKPPWDTPRPLAKAANR